MGVGEGVGMGEGLGVLVAIGFLREANEEIGDF